MARGRPARQPRHVSCRGTFRRARTPDGWRAGRPRAYTGKCAVLASHPPSTSPITTATTST
jgi:hypothetical protein